jgi:oxalyl-CoA decarboxylase
VVVVFNNGGIYRGDDVNRSGGADPAPTVLLQAHYEKLIEAFGGDGHFVTRPAELAQALEAAITAGRPALINCIIDPTAGTESGHIKNLNPKSALAAQEH